MFSCFNVEEVVILSHISNNSSNSCQELIKYSVDHIIHYLEDVKY